MTVLPAMALAACVVYVLSDYIARFFSPNITAVIDLLLFVTVMVATNSFLKNLRGD
jgi:hypothetical protein